MFVRDKKSRDNTVESWHRTSRSLLERLKNRIWRRLHRHRFQRYSETRPEGLEFFSQAWTVEGERVAAALPKADVYNLHWIRGFIDPLPFFKVVDQPVVWTLHDMNPFTGGCHYNVGCRKFEERCGACPQLGSEDETDLSRTVWLRKRDAYRTALERNSLHIVATSKWMAEQAQISGLFSDAPVHVIPLGLDANTFRPRNTEGLRSALEIPQNHRVVLFVAESTTNHRKGFGLLADAFESLEAKNVTLLSIGGNAPDLTTSVEYRHLGRIGSDVLLSIFYSFADLFIIPSRQEAFGQTALEAMACGTPVVGFDTGGIPDMVRPGETGWLAETSDVRALRMTIEQALSEEEKRNQFGSQCRAVVEEEYTLQVQARSYRDLYEHLLNEN
jgi:glycosyltransferase involved in cell wall biosynthesis